jgi:capsular exopolysaccharide synthesis family protein
MSNKRADLERVSSRDNASLLRPGYLKEADYFDEYGYGYNPEATGGGFRLQNIWRAIRKHKWLVSIIPILVTLVVAVEVNRPKPIYEAAAIVEIKKDTWVMVKSGDNIIEEEADTVLSSPTVKTNTLMIKSRPLLQDVAARLALDRQPDFFDVTQKKRPFLETIKYLTIASAPKEQAIGLIAPPHGRPQDEESSEEGEEGNQETQISEEERARLSPYISVLSANLMVSPIKDTRALEISFLHTNPHIASAVANSVAECFIERSFQKKTDRFNRTTAWLERMTRDLKNKVARTEQTLANYMREHNIYAPEAKDTLTSDKLTQLHTQVLRAETDRVLKESLYEEVRAGRIAQLPEAFADQKTAALQAQLGQLAVQAAQLDVSYGSKNPQVIEVKQKMAAIQQQIDSSRSALEEKLKAEYGRAVRDEQTLRAALDQAKLEAVEKNQDSVQYNLLKQEADTARTLYTQFLQKTNQANIQLAERPSNVHLIEPAEVPSYPMTQNGPLYIFLAFLMSFTACVGLAFLLERLSGTIKTVEDINRYIQLPAIGVIPKIKQTPARQLTAKNGKQDQRPEGASGGTRLRLAEFNSRPIVSLEDRSVAAEAYRAVSTSVLLSSSDTPPKTILFTSGLPGEGKTTTAINTAISLAQFGASVLLIDCDLRNPAGHKVFDVDNSRGLSTYLAGDVAITDLISNLQIPNLSFLPAGPIPENSAKLIISRKMKNLLQTLGESYDHILIDSPPLLGITDPVILATLVDGVIVVMHGSKSTRDIARRARQELSNVGANIFGVVLNNIDYTDLHYYQPSYKYMDPNAETA